MTGKDIQKRQADTEKHRQGLDKTLTRLSQLRLLTAILTVLGLVAYWRRDMVSGAALAVVMLLAFVVLVYRFGLIQKEMDGLARISGVLKRYEDRLTDAWQDLPETGEAYRSKDNTLSTDLDLFGKGSLFQYLSVTHSATGNDALARLLTQPDLDRIADRQASVRELLADDDWAIRFEALAYEPKAAKRDREKAAELKLKAYARGEGPETVDQAALIGLGLPIALAVTLGLAVAGLASYMLPVAVFFMQMALAITLAAPINKYKETILVFQTRLEGLNERFQMLLDSPFESAYLTQMKKDLANAPEGIAALNRLVGLWNLRENFLLYFILCGCFAWDFNMIARIDRWRAAYGASFVRWLDWVGEVEALSSLCTVGRLRPGAAQAEILSTEAPSLEMVKATHPLLPPATAVANDYRQSGETTIITGSNMSGKSTFMRTIGLNAVLAYAGGYVCARRFAISPMRIFTSMRVQDDVGEGISTFYGEILRIKAMADYAVKEKPMLVLIDEIFKGTNSADRIIGAEAAIKKLSQPWSMTLVTTHDFELCDLAEDPAVSGRNMHFEEHYEGDTIQFDYTIRPGRCRTTNAKELMRMAGLLDPADVNRGDSDVL